MKRLLLWTNMYPSHKAPYYGTFVHSTEKAWRKVLGEENVELVAIKEKPNGVLSKVCLYAGLLLRCIASLFNSSNSTIVEIHYPVYFLPVICLIKVLRVKRYIVLRFHGSDLKKINDVPFFSLLFKFVKNEVQLYVVPSDYYREKLSKELNLPIEKIVKVYPDCVGGEEFTSGENKKAYVSEVVFNIGFVSRLEPMKNCRELIEAFAKLPIPNACLTIIGDGSERQQLEALALKLGLSSQVKFLGAIERRKLPFYMEEFSVFVFPSISETESFGLVALEALSCGIPVIANKKLEAASEYLQDGRNGFFYEKGVDGLAQAIEDFYQLSHSSKIELSSEARKVQQQFSYYNVFTSGVNSILSRQQSDTNC